VRTSGDPERLLPALQRAVAEVDKDQPLVAVSSMEANLAEFIAPQRFDTMLLAAFAALGLLLAAVGMFGVMSYGVSQRTREIGIRIAIGATSGNVLRMVLIEGLRIAVAGLVIGWAVSWGLTGYLKSILFSVKPGDPATLAVVSVVALATTAIACYLPARRASRMEVTAALRSE
jgi:putative ABC transport system permease protein